jgi:hypothetical protein
MQPLRPDDIDLMTRLVVAENNKADPAEQAAIAHVMLNRYASGDFGGSMQDVLKARTKGGGYQFTPLGTTNNSPYKVDPSSPAYQQARQVVEGATQGSIPDPTNGATYYRNQDVAPGKPAGAVGAGTKIGAHTFFATNAPTGGPSPDDAAAAQFLENRRAATSAPEPTNADDDAAAKFLEQRRAAISTSNSRVSSDFDALASQDVHPMTANPPASPLARLFGMPDNPTRFQTGTSIDISTPEAANAAKAQRFFGPVMNWAQQNPVEAGMALLPGVGALVGGGVKLAAPVVRAAAAPIMASPAAQGVASLIRSTWPITAPAIGTAIGTEAYNHGEAAYQYGKNLLNSFSE